MVHLIHLHLHIPNPGQIVYILVKIGHFGLHKWLLIERITQEGHQTLLVLFAAGVGHVAHIGQVLAEVRLLIVDLE